MTKEPNKETPSNENKDFVLPKENDEVATEHPIDEIYCSKTTDDFADQNPIQRPDEKSYALPAAFAQADLDYNDYVFKTPKRVKKNKKKKLGKPAKICITVLCCLIFLAGCAAATLLIFINMGKDSLLTNNLQIDPPSYATEDNNGQYITYNGVKYKYNSNITSVLFMGIDKEALTEVSSDYGTSGDADALMLFSVDTSTGKTNLISISRDTMAEIDTYSTSGSFAGTKTQQLCLAYAYGDGKALSCEYEVTAVRRLFYNLPINSYLAMDLSGIDTINDAINGVDVTALETIGPFTEGKKITLRGDEAEQYVRLRDTSKLDSNNQRMARQKQYLSAFFTKTLTQTKADFNTPLKLFNQAKPFVETDITPPEVMFFASNMLQHNYTNIEIQNVPGEVKQGETYAEYHIDETKFFELFLSVYYTPVS